MIYCIPGKIFNVIWVLLFIKLLSITAIIKLMFGISYSMLSSKLGLSFTVMYIYIKRRDLPVLDCLVGRDTLLLVWNIFVKGVTRCSTLSSKGGLILNFKYI